MIKLTNCIKACEDGKHRERPLGRLTRQVHHRITFSHDGPSTQFPDVKEISVHELTGPLVAERFLDVRRASDRNHSYLDRPGRWTGGQMPYSFVGRTDGVIDQCLELGDIGPHALRWSSAAVGLAWVGDFRKAEPTAEQVVAAVSFGALLLAYGLVPYSHTELSGGSSDPNKSCPGALFRMHDLRRQMMEHPNAHMSAEDAEVMMLSLGVVF